MLAIVVFMYMDPRFLQIFKKILIFKVPVIKKNDSFATSSFGRNC